MTTLAAPLGYFGGKRLTAPQIVRHFRPHTTYYDLFAGSLAVLFAKEPSRLEVASELNPDVVNLLRCLANDTHGYELFLFAQRHPITEQRFLRAAQRMHEPMPEGEINFIRAWDFLLTSWQGPSGLAGTTAKPRFAKRNTASGGSTAARWRAVADSIPAWHERLRNVEFRNQSAFEILEDIPDRENVTVYSDAPYYGDTRRGGKYVYDFQQDDHARLADALNRFNKTCIVVSYYAHPELDRMYQGWDRHQIEAPRKLNNTSGGQTDTIDAGEVVYVKRGNVNNKETR